MQLSPLMRALKHTMSTPCYRLSLPTGQARGDVPHSLHLHLPHSRNSQSPNRSLKLVVKKYRSVSTNTSSVHQKSRPPLSIVGSVQERSEGAAHLQMAVIAVQS